MTTHYERASYFMTTERASQTMATSVPVEPSDYAHPEKLVSTSWVAEHKDHPNVVVLESNEDTLLYSTGHIPGAVKIDWHTELNDPRSEERRVGKASRRRGA